MTINAPSSFCTISTKKTKSELAGLLLSLSVYHPNSNVYIYCDSESEIEIKNLSPKLLIIPHFYIELNNFSAFDYHLNSDVKELINLDLYSRFITYKPQAIKKALEFEKDTLFIDVFTLITGKIDCIDNSKKLGVLPTYANKDYNNKYGYYNSNLIWTNDIYITELWNNYLINLHSFEHLSIQELTKKYENQYFEFPEEYNIDVIRFFCSEKNDNEIGGFFQINNQSNNNGFLILYKKKEIKTFQSAFNTNYNYNYENENENENEYIKRFKKYNTFLHFILKKSKHAADLLILNRIQHKKWTIKLPYIENESSVWFHKNDGMRELLSIIPTKQKDVMIYFDENIKNCWLSDSVLLYDWDRIDWIENDHQQATLVLMGNGSLTNEYLQISNDGGWISPWTYWCKYPKILEQFIKTHKPLNYEQRINESIFIGNYENSVQQQYRTNKNWNDFVSVFYCTSGTKNLFTHLEYLEHLSKSKFGLCLRGYGIKCHREIELMALGVVPIITPEVDIKSFSQPPIENVHYIIVSNPEEIPIKIKNITSQKWTEMSNNCIKWYMENSHSDVFFNLILTKVLYKIG